MQFTVNLLKEPSLFREKCYIGGGWLAADTEQQEKVLNPADATVVGQVPVMGQSETRRAIQIAQDAFQSWRKAPAKQRFELLNRWYQLVMQHKDDLAKILVAEQGKPLLEAKMEIAYGASYIQWFAEEAKRVYGDLIPSPFENQRLLVFKQPLGVVGAITPWNFPSAMITRKVAPALAAGCTVIVKPAPQTPFSALALAELAHQAGIPAGVLNVITGQADAIGRELTANPLVKKISFTGSTAVGKKLMEQCAPTIKKLSLELGGHAPFIVFADADIELAVKAVLRAKFRNSGQTCISANRLFVHETIYTEFVSQLAAIAAKMKLGDGLAGDTEQGPLISQQALEKVKRQVEDAVTKGAQIVTGGKQPSLGGTFYEPTVLANATMAMQIAQEETFGPVAPVFSFQDEEEVIEQANNTPYGLGSYFYTRDYKRIWRVAEALDYGMVGVNDINFAGAEMAPFGGMKESGMGREGSKYGILEYLDIKGISIGL